MDSRFGYRIIRTTPELEAFVPAWSALWRDDPRATPFQSPEWLLPWWRQFQQPELRAVVMMDEGRPAGFLPFYIYREPGTGERQFLLLGAGTTDYLDGVFSAACGIEGVRMALDLLVAEGGWDSLHTSQMRPDSVLLRTLACSHDLAVERFESESCLRMPARRISELPAKIRRNATYYRTRAIRMGKLELSTADESECKGSFETLRRLHAERWALRGEAGVLADERVVSWHQQALPLLHRSGMLRFYALRLDGETIGTLYALIDPVWRPVRFQYCYLPAFALKFAELSPGTVLLALVAEAAVEECVQTIDMLRGDETYKRFWHPTAVPTYGCRISLRSPA